MVFINPELPTSDPKVKELISKAVNDYLFSYISIIGECESPIEQLLGVAIRIRGDENGLCAGFNFFVQPQAKVNCFGKEYWADFCVALGNPLGRPVEILVECDGHDFHEKTKSQAARDKQRDRHLVAAGYKVIHFTGSEIWNNPLGCADEVINILLGEERKGGQ